MKKFKISISGLLLLIATTVFGQTTTEQIVSKKFKTYISPKLNGRSLKTKIFQGDLNGDKQIDFIIDYCIQATDADRNAGGGNALINLACMKEGIAVYLKQGTDYILSVDKSKEEFKTSQDISFDIKKIEGNAIVCEASGYKDDDPRCCPSLKKTVYLKLINGKLEKSSTPTTKKSTVTRREQTSLDSLNAALDNAVNDLNNQVDELNNSVDNTNPTTSSVKQPTKTLMEVENYFKVFLGKNNNDLYEVFLQHQPQLNDCKAIFKNEYYKEMFQFFNNTFAKLSEEMGTQTERFKNKTACRGEVFNTNDVIEDKCSVCPGIMKRIEIGKKIKPNIVCYVIKFLEKPTDKFGLSYSFFTFINAHWVFFPMN
jgi:hypothetical protein